MSIERWISQAQRGDAAAFNNLVNHHQATAYHVAYHHLGNGDDAMDACQEAMLSAWRAMPRFEGGPAQFRAWLLRIVINASRDRLRAEGRRRQQPLEYERDGETRARPLPAPGMTPEEFAEIGDLRALLSRCLAELSEDHRTVILLDQAGLGYSEIADVLGIEVGTVKSRMSRARAHMRDLLTDQAGTRALEPSAPGTRSGGKESGRVGGDADDTEQRQTSPDAEQLEAGEAETLRSGTDPPGGGAALRGAQETATGTSDDAKTDAP